MAGLVQLPISWESVTFQLVPLGTFTKLSSSFQNQLIAHEIVTQLIWSPTLKSLLQDNGKLLVTFLVFSHSHLTFPMKQPPESLILCFVQLWIPFMRKRILDKMQCQTIRTQITINKIHSSGFQLTEELFDTLILLSLRME